MARHWSRSSSTPARILEKFTFSKSFDNPEYATFKIINTFENIVEKKTFEMNENVVFISNVVKSFQCMHRRQVSSTVLSTSRPSINHRSNPPSRLTQSYPRTIKRSIAALDLIPTLHPTINVNALEGGPNIDCTSVSNVDGGDGDMP